MVCLSKGANEMTQLDEVQDLLELLKKMPDMQMVRPTQCHLNAHAFTWTAGGTSSEPLNDLMKCDCGLYTWRQVKLMREA